MTDSWLKLDPTDFAWLRSIAEEVRRHDDNEEFVAGLDPILGRLVRQALANHG